MTTGNPFNEENVDPNHKSTMIAAMDAETLLGMLEHYLINKPNFDLNQRSTAMLGEYADIDLDPRIARTMGLKIPTQAEREAVEREVNRLRDIVHTEAIRVALPFMLVALVRSDTHEQARELIQEFTGDLEEARDKLQAQIQSGDVLEILDAPMLLSGDFDDDELSV